VRKFVLHRWAVVFLMVSRLIVGEFAHAMPHSEAAAKDVAVLASETMAACQDHEGVAAEPSSAPAHGTHADEDDCCKAKGCKCPCVHLPSAVPEPVVVGMAHHDLHRLSEPTLGIATQRLSAVFRPPA
jgi:hypothetical protein